MSLGARGRHGKSLARWAPREERLRRMATRVAARKRQRAEGGWVQLSDAERQRVWESAYGERRLKRRIERTIDMRKRRRREEREASWVKWWAGEGSGGDCGSAPT